jgi:hypothetical protein
MFVVKGLSGEFTEFVLIGVVENVWEWAVVVAK